MVRGAARREARGVSRRFSSLAAFDLRLLKLIVIMTNSNGRILYEGLSPYNGKPFACIVTGLTEPTSNDKTLIMVNVSI